MVAWVADGAQVVGSAVLWGVGKTVPAALIDLVGFYIVGFYIVVLPSHTPLPSEAAPELSVSGGASPAASPWSHALLVLWIRRRGPASLA